MAQAISPLAGSDKFKDSYGKLNSSDLALQTLFSGDNPPANPYPFQLWADTSDGYLKQCNAAGDAFVRVAKLADPDWGLLPKTGGGLSGVLDMNGNAILNVGAGSGASAARQQDLDLKAPLSNPNFSGQATIDADPSGGTSLARRSWIDATYLPRAGGTLTGALVLSAAGTLGLHPVGLDQLKTFVQFNASTGHRHDGSDARKVRAADLNTESTTDTHVLTANGSGGVTWRAPQSSAVLDAAGTELFDRTTSNGAFVTVSLATGDLIPAKSTIAVLRVRFLSHSVGRYMELRLKKQGGSTYTTYYFSPQVDNAESIQQVLVPLDGSRQFAYQAILQGGGGSPVAQVTAWLAGYIQQPV